jgi:cobalt/nickel transport protein
MRIFNKTAFFLIALLSITLVGGVSFAHFQMIYTPKSALSTDEPGKINLLLVFTHPFEAGHTMDMGADESGKITPPAAFGVMTFDKKADKVVKTDLLKDLKPVEFTSLTNKGKAYTLEHKIGGIGDSVFYLDPAPYYDKTEDHYMRQITKVIVNRGGAPSAWDKAVGLDAEIVPLDKPYALWTGNLFRGVVMKKEGDKMVPVPDAEIEVEFLNHEIKNNAFGKQEKVKAPQDAFVTQTIKANAQGEFAYALPKAGWWGFSAVGAGGEAKHQGKPMTVDAVIWVQTQDMK